MEVNIFLGNYELNCAVEDLIYSFFFKVPTMAIEKVFIYNNTSIVQDEVCSKCTDFSLQRKELEKNYK